jgi:hypothetical protein
MTVSPYDFLCDSLTNVTIVEAFLLMLLRGASKEESGHQRVA